VGLAALKTRESVEAFIEENQLSKFVRMPGKFLSRTVLSTSRAADLYVSCAFSDGRESAIEPRSIAEHDGSPRSSDPNPKS
jgi:hypothetical protein